MKIKNHILKKSIFAVAKSGTISLEISSRKIPSIIIYKINFINYLILKALVKVKYANILNIAAGSQMIIPELLQSKCNPKEIFKFVSSFLEDQNKIKNKYLILKSLESFRTKNLPTDLAADSLRKVCNFRLHRLQSLFNFGSITFQKIYYFSYKFYI